jgi:hypothetical protein
VFATEMNTLHVPREGASVGVCSLGLQ